MDANFPVVIPDKPVRALYVVGVVVVFLFLMGFLWFICYAVLSPLRLAAMGQAVQYYEVDTFDNLLLADTFMTNLWTYFLVIAVVGLLYWVWIYSQRHGRGVYE